MLTPLTTTMPRVGITLSISATVPLSLPAITWQQYNSTAAVAGKLVSAKLHQQCRAQCTGQLLASVCWLVQPGSCVRTAAAGTLGTISTHQSGSLPLLKPAPPAAQGRLPPTAAATKIRRVKRCCSVKPREQRSEQVSKGCESPNNAQDLPGSCWSL
jgi:hypothetical protein